MTYDEIKAYAKVNEYDEAKVAELAESIKENGWQGAPILVCESLGRLVTGSHRMAALDMLYNDPEFDGAVFDEEVAEDVADIINGYCEANDCTFDDIQFDNLSSVFGGTRIEEYKNEIEEW